MASRSSSSYYRRSPYRKKTLRNVFIISLIIAIAVFLAFIILGNLLNQKVSDNAEETEPPVYTHKTVQTKPQPVSPSYTVSIKGRAFDLLSANPKDTAASIAQSGYTAVSLNLSANDGALRYASEVATRFAYPMTSDRVDLASLASKLLSTGLRTSATLTLNSFSEDNNAARSVLQACEAAIVCEVSGMGINDVLLRCPDIKQEYTDELIALAERVKQIDEKAIVGLALTPEFLESENTSESIEKIISAFDFIAMDITKIPDGSDTSEQIHGVISTDKYYYILRYNMRMLLHESASDEEAKAIYELMNANSISNWQTISVK